MNPFQPAYISKPRDLVLLSAMGCSTLIQKDLVELFVLNT